jgi:hypothetical protein
MSMYEKVSSRNMNGKNRPYTYAVGTTGAEKTGAARRFAGSTGLALDTTRLACLGMKGQIEKHER